MARGSLAPFGWGRQNDPFAMLRQEMEQLFDNVMRGGPMQPAGADMGSLFAPRMDVCEDENEIQLTAEMPGVKPQDVQLTLDGDLLTIRGEQRSERRDEKKDFHMMERSYGVFQRSLRLPQPVEADKVQARMDNGVLTVKIPKSGEQQRARRIEVQGGAGGEQGATVPPTTSGGPTHH